MTAVLDSSTFLTVSELARTWGVDEKTVRRHAEEFGAVRIGRAIRFPPDVLSAPTVRMSARAQRPEGAANRPVKGRIR